VPQLVYKTLYILCIIEYPGPRALQVSELFS